MRPIEFGANCIELEGAGSCDVFMRCFPIEFCRRHDMVVAIASESSSPRAYISSAESLAGVDIAGRRMGLPLAVRITESECIRKAINRFYEQRAIESRASAEHPSLQEVLVGHEQKSSIDDLLESETRGPVVQLVNQMLLDAIQLGASDIHLQPFADEVIVRMRLDGVLTPAQSISKQIQDEVVSRLKVAGSMDIAEKRLPQDGRATVCVGDRIIDLRLAAMPTSYGERIVVRLLDKSARLYRLSEIGMAASMRDQFETLIQVEHGLILVTGPTGSGKSTTLYAALQELDTSTRNAVTLEDPIEYQLDGISQTQINTKKGMTFAGGLRSVLRQDPDIIMLGEIRDQETAVMAIQSALTGHMVFSTLHTNDAASAVTRLLDLGIEPYLVSSSLLAVLAQRLVRRICPVCQNKVNEVEQTIVSSVRASDCGNCRGTGYRGREGIYELLVIDETIRALIQSRSNASTIRNEAVKNGMRLLSNDGMRKVREGRTTVAEVERVTMRTGI